MRERLGRAQHAARVSRLLGLALPLAIVLAGCSNPSPNDRSKAGLEATGKDIVANVEAARFRRACEDLTSQARLRLAVFPAGGCSGALAFARGLLAVDGRARLGRVIDGQLHTTMRQLKLRDDEARAGGVVIARYEQGRWGFETVVDAAGRQRLKADLQAAVGRLRGDGAERLLGPLQAP